MRNVYAAVRESLVEVGSRALDRSAVLSTANGALWRWWFALRDGGAHVRVGETSARFEVTTRSEHVRAEEFGGERHVLAALLDELDGDEVVWDVGACVGTYACFVAKTLESGRVVAFEPEPTNRQRLVENLRANAPEERWMVSPFALSDRAGERFLASEFLEPGAGHHYLASGDTGATVETRRGDRLDAWGIPSPSVVKVDVQGAEMAVLEGLTGILTDVQVLYVEVHPEQCRRYGTTAREVEEWLRDRGYGIEHLGGPSTRRSGVYFVRAAR